MSHPAGQFGKTTDALSDIDVVEAQLDDAVRQLITEVYPGTTLLQEQVNGVPINKAFCLILSLSHCIVLFCSSTFVILGSAARIEISPGLHIGVPEQGESKRRRHIEPDGQFFTEAPRISVRR